MAQFYGTLQGSRGPASRLGSKNSGLQVSAASWSGGIEIDLWYDSTAKVDRFEIRQAMHHGGGIHEVIAKGVIGKPVALPVAIAGRLRDLWSHLTLLATGINPPLSNNEATQIAADLYHDLTSEEIT